MGYSPGFLLKNGQFPTLANSPEIDTNSTLRSQKSIQKGLGGFSESLERFPELTKSAMFKTMGYSPGFLLKNGQYPTLGNSPEIDTNGRARGQKSIQKGLAGVSESLERFRGLAKIRHVENHGLQPRLFAQKRPISDPREFTRNRHKQSRKELEIHFQACSRRIWGLERFPELTKIRHVQNHGLQPKLFAQKRPISDPREFTRNRHKQSRKQLEIHLDGFRRRESLERFPGLTKIRHVRNHGLQPRLFAQKRPISDPREFARNRHKQSRKEFEIHFQACRRRFWEFGAISRTYQNPPCSKPWAIAQAFCSKTANCRPSRIHPKST